MRTKTWRGQPIGYADADDLRRALPNLSVDDYLQVKQELDKREVRQRRRDEIGMTSVVDFEAARKRMTQTPPENPILAALDALALALADHVHVWTDRERQLYENAVGYILSDRRR